MRPGSVGYSRFHYAPNEIINFQSALYDQSRCLLDKLSAEQINTYGFESVYFLTTTDPKYDAVFQNDPTVRLVHKFKIRMLYPLPTRARQYTKWGIELTESVVGHISKESFKISMGYYGGTMWYDKIGITSEEAERLGVKTQTKPKIGDVMYFKDNDTYYEIVDVDDRQNENELNFGHSPVWYVFLKVMKDEHLSYISQEVKETINDGADGVIPIKVADSETQQAQNLNDFFDIKKTVSEEIKTKQIEYVDVDLTSETPPMEQSKPFTPFVDSLSKTNGKNQKTEDEYLKDIGWY